MPKRSGNWNPYVSEKLSVKAFAREYLLASMEEGKDLLESLRDLIRQRGIKEFCAERHLPEATVKRVLAGSHSTSMATYEKILKTFHLKLRLAVEKPGHQKLAA